MSLTMCTSVLNIKNFLGASYSTAELVCESRKSLMNSGDAIYLNKPIRVTATPSVEIQDLTFISVVNTNTSITIIYNNTGTAGSEVVSVIANAISVSMQSGVSTATQIKTAIQNSVAASLLVSVILSGTGATAQTFFTPAVSLTDETCVLALSETATNSQQVVFYLNWNDGSNYSSIVFDPVTIPNSSYVDLSTILTISRG